MEFRVNQSIGIDPVANDESRNAALGSQTSPAAQIQRADPPGALPAGATLLVPVDGIVRLPAGTSLDAIRVVGTNLVITLPDGQVLVIVDGALSPPQFILGTITIPAGNIAALIAGQEPEPAAGAPQSSGGNFAEMPGDIGDPFILGDLLSSTEFAFANLEEDEVIPAALDEEPEISIVTPDQPLGSIAATATVSESALAGRGSEPSGSDPASPAETIVGTILITSPNLPNIVAINGTAITAVGQTVSTPLGVLTITSIAPDTIGYSYTLADNSTNPDASETVTITVTDGDGDIATATLTLTVTDDVPAARDDTENVGPSLYLAQTGNVITGVGTASGASGADTLGADNATITGVRNSESSEFAASGTVIQGLFGKLLMLPNGNYSYVRSSGTPGGVSDIFTYQLTDGDGDSATATLTINIGDSSVGLVVPSIGDEGTVVSEAGLSERDGETAGSRDGDGSNLTFGAIAFDAPDGPAVIKINGVTVTDVDQEIALPTGTLVILAIGPDTLEYAFVLNDNVVAAVSTQPIIVTVTDQDGDSASASFEIDILDDRPTAANDGDMVVAGSGQNADGNVLTGFGGSDTNNNDGVADVKGADGAIITRISFGGAEGDLGGATAGAYGTLKLNADGSYQYTLNDTHPDIVGLSGTEIRTETFEYTLTDADGDESQAILTITIRGKDDNVTITGLDSDDAEATVFEHNLSDGSEPDTDALVRTGSFEFATADGLARLEIEGEILFDGNIVSGLALTTDHGILTITKFDPSFAANGDIVSGTITYTYELKDNIAHDGTDEGALTEGFVITITDSDGTVATSTLDVNIIDDNVLAVADDSTANEGASLVVDAMTGLLSNDVPGADEASIYGVRPLGSDAVGIAIGGIGMAISGLYGQLTVAADGSYFYESDPNAVPPEGAEDVFVYSLQDGDGDISTTTLTIHVSDSGLAATTLALKVEEAGLADGSDPDSSNESVSGDLNENVVAGSGPFEFALVGDGVGNRGVLQLGTDGSYTYTLTNPVDGSPANNGNNIVPAVETFTFIVTDAFGNTAQNVIVIDVIDDVPVARSDPAIIIAEDAPVFSGDLLENDSQGADAATVTSINVKGVAVIIQPSGVTLYANALGTYTFQSDGAWTFTPVSASSAAPLIADFTYTVTDGDGDTSAATQQIRVVDGANPVASDPIALTLDDQFLELGSTPLVDQPVVVEGDIQFSVGSDTIVSIVFGDVTDLGGGLIWTKISDTQIVGMDIDRAVVVLDLTVNGTTATVTATLESNYAFHPDVTADDFAMLGSVNVVATDSDGDEALGRVDISVSDDVPTISARTAVPGYLTVDESNLAVNATANFEALFNIVTGADQPTNIVYSFAVSNASGLVDVVSGSPISLHAIGNMVEGRVAGTPGIVAFRLTVEGNGHASLDQIRAVRHSNTSNPDDPATISSPLIQLTATITDSDGDQASATLNIGNTLLFRDDGPLLDIIGADTNAVLTTTQDADTRGAAFDVATANLSSAFVVATANYGADGPNGAAVGWAYQLALGSGAAVTGMTSNGKAITLGLVSGEIVASAGGNPVFTISVNPTTGVITLTQFAEVDHPLPGSSGHYATQYLDLPLNLIELRGVATITDRDGDSTSDSVSIDLGGNIRFADDGPGVSTTPGGPVLVLDESFLAVDATADLSSLFTTTLDFGADGAGTVAYQLGTTVGPSGLMDALTGEAVNLSILDGVIYGRTTAHEVFRVSVAEDGVVTFDQSRAVIHSPDSGPDQTRFLTGANLITLTATATDGDSDTATATADITGYFGIKDDAPTAINDVDNVARDGQIFADGNVLNGVGGVDENTVDGAADNAGADGGLVVTGVAFQATAGAVGTALSGAHGVLVLGTNGNYRYDLNVNDPAVIALGSNETLTDTFLYTVRDADGDISTATITISITGANDFPVARADTNWVIDGISGSDPSATGNVLQDISHAGAPFGRFADVGDNDPDFEPINVVTAGTYVGLYGTLVITANGAYTYSLNEDAAAVNALDAGQTLTDSFGYTISDGLLSVASTLTITVFGTNDSPTIGATTARVSEEGLTGGVADTAPNATLDATNSASFSGMLAIGDLDAGETLTASLGNPGAILTAGGVAVTWAGIGTGTLVGSASGNEVIRITLAPNGAYNVTLTRAIDHPNTLLEDLTEFTVPVSVSDGTVTTTNATAIRIIIEDDGPTAIGETGSSAQVQQDVNTLFILDFSDSIDDGELDIMLGAVKNALTQLDSSALSALTIKFVIFSSLSLASPAFSSAADANAYLDSLNPAEGGTRPDTIGFNTNYTSAIQSALANFAIIPGASNQVFFLSDGNPNQSVQFSPPNPPIIPTVINSLTSATATAWNDFVDSNDVNVTVIGVDKDPAGPLQIQRLRDIDLNDAPDNMPIVVDDFDDLVATLLAVVVPVAVPGDLDANDAYGADGGRLLSIMVGTSTYTWDGASSIAISSGGVIAGSILTVTTPMGGTLQLNFANGQYNYQPPSPIMVTATEVFSYRIVDKDGDTASADLSITITALAPPVVLDLDGDGVEFVSSHAGVLFDYNADGVAESTAWVGADDALLAIDKNGDGRVNNGSEIIFGGNGLSDLQGVAAHYDSNKDGQLDNADIAYSSFGIWQDSNSNGITDPGEFQSLSEAGILSISLVSDGISYAAAGEEVFVRGEAIFTRANGQTGKVADAAFATNFAEVNKRTALPNEASGLGTALAAAAFVAALPLAANDSLVSWSESPLQSDTDDIRHSPSFEPLSVERVDAADLMEDQTNAHDDSRTSANAPKVGHGDVDEYHFNTSLQSDQALEASQNSTMQAKADIIAHDEQQFAPSAGTDQVFLTPASPVGAPSTADEVKTIVLEAVEGQSVDLNALVAAYMQPMNFQSSLAVSEFSLSMAGDVPSLALGNMFMPDMAEQHIVVQLEQAAITGHT